MAFWHGRILPAIYFFRHRDIVVITSDNFDGEWTAKIIHRFGYTTARGSTSRNAARAALRAKRRMEEGHAVGITLDGPRGPALVAQPGALWLAKVTGQSDRAVPRRGASELDAAELGRVADSLSVQPHRRRVRRADRDSARTLTMRCSRPSGASSKPG